MSSEAPFLHPQILPISPLSLGPDQKTPHFDRQRCTPAKNNPPWPTTQSNTWFLLKSIMGCLPEISSRVHDHRAEANNDDQLGILAFEAAKTMSRLLSLYKSLSNNHLAVLKKEMKSQGVAFLNSEDDNLLFSLACAERLEELDKITIGVARLSRRCHDYELSRFDLVYTDLKLGVVEFGRLEYGSRDVQKKVEKMEKLVSATAELYAALEVQAEIEICERKTRDWKGRANLEIFAQRVKYQRKLVHHYKEISLWTKTFDICVGLMARIVCIIYARICSVFGPFFPILPSFPLRKTPSPDIRPDYCLIEPIKEKITSHSGPLTSKAEPISVRFYSRKSVFFFRGEDPFGESKKDRILHAAGPTTVGGSGLALRYANVILSVEKYLDPTISMDEDSRASLYQMLPENLKSSVKSKLRKSMRCHDDDSSLAVGWRDALGHIMGWLAPMAHNTITWQMERKFEKMRFDTKPTVLSWQTLHFSDKEKTEAAIAEVLVGLSYICRYEKC
nr:AF211537_1 Avr9/Cf-9 rapidly elicited protein 137 [Ipomoea batatas]